MKSAVAIAIDGVLRREIGYQPIPEGIALYKTLIEWYNVVLLGDRDNEQYRADVEHLLMTEQLHEHSKVFYDGIVGWPADRRVSQLLSLRNSGMSLAFVLEADPKNSAAIFAAGFNVLHFMHAQYARPSWRPDYEQDVTPWDALVEKEVGLKTAKVRDKRTAQ